MSDAGYDCIFPHAPHILPMTSTIIVDGQEVEVSNGDRENARAWFTYSSKDYSDASLALKEVPMVYHGIDDSINQIRGLLKANEEYYLLGFSQGATFCHILSVLAHHAQLLENKDAAIQPFGRIRKVILISGFTHMHQYPLTESIHDVTKNNIRIQSLHIYGEGDTSVPRHFSEDLAKSFVNPEVYVHEKGHFIPHNKPLLDRVIQFLDSK